MRGNQRKRVKRTKANNIMFKRSVLLIGATTGVLALGLGGKSLEMHAKVNDYDVIIQELEVRMQQEEERIIEIEEYEIYTDTDEYVEEVAREKLGMAYPDEYILKATE